MNCCSKRFAKPCRRGVDRPISDGNWEFSLWAPRLQTRMLRRAGWVQRHPISKRCASSGFPAVSAEQIFQAFYATKPAELGMGLSICRSSVEAHGGQLRAAAGGDPTDATVTFPVHSNGSF
jgi:signal transduction histidine kinase